MKDEPILCTTEVSALERNGVVETSDRQLNVRTLVGCGHAMPDTKIVIVHPESLTACAHMTRWAKSGCPPERDPGLLEPA